MFGYSIPGIFHLGLWILDTNSGYGFYARILVLNLSSEFKFRNLHENPAHELMSWCLTCLAWLSDRPPNHFMSWVWVLIYNIESTLIPILDSYLGFIILGQDSRPKFMVKFQGGLWVWVRNLHRNPAHERGCGCAISNTLYRFRLCIVVNDPDWPYYGGLGLGWFSDFGLVWFRIGWIWDWIDFGLISGWIDFGIESESDSSSDFGLEWVGLGCELDLKWFGLDRNEMDWDWMNPINDRLEMVRPGPE